MSEFEGRHITLIDLNLISGSSDLFRNAVGGYFQNATDVDGKLIHPPQFIGAATIPNINSNIYAVTSFYGEAIGENILRVQDRKFDHKIADQDTILPHIKFVCALHGDPTSQNLTDVATASKYWKTLFTGGNFAGKKVEPIYTDLTFDEHYTEISLPYTGIDRRKLKSSTHMNNFNNILYRYNRHNREYQNYTDKVSTEMAIPNWHILNLAFEQSEALGQVEQEILDQYSLDSKQSALKNFLLATDSLMDIREPQKFLGYDIPAAASLNSTQAIEGRYKNIIINSAAATRVSNLENIETITKERSVLPYYTEIALKTENLQGSTYTDILAKYDCSTLFLRTLKEVFLEQTAGELPLNETQFMLNQKKLIQVNSSDTDDTETTSNTTSFRSVDMVDMMLHSYKQIKNNNQDFIVLDYDNIENKAARDIQGVYRSFNARNNIRALNDVVKTLTGPDTPGPGAPFYISNIVDLLDIQTESFPPYDRTPDPTTTEYLKSPQPRYNEIVAYRVEKIAGSPPENDIPIAAPIQDYWIFNNGDDNELNLVDSQVKYDTDYTYKIYAYYAVRGIKYQFSDLQISRIVGTSRDESATTEPKPLIGYCVEYYDPLTGNSKPDLLNGVVESIGDISSLSSEAQKVALSIVGEELPPYHANFITTLQPSLKIVEVPIQTRQIRITDYLPNSINVNAFANSENTNTLTFELNLQTYHPEPYPLTISMADMAFKDTFIESNNLIDSSKVGYSAKSATTNIDVYRINRKPTSITDFDNNIIDSVDMTTGDSYDTYTARIFKDTISTNTKYYYLFRSRSELNISGNLSQIIVAELVDDGGYKYGLFNTITPADMEASNNNFKNISEPLKKVFQLTPNISQMLLDDTAADYAQPAETQYNSVIVGTADTKIWGKTFKVRLTSKKTGKKTDLNITYNEPNVLLSELE